MDGADEESTDEVLARAVDALYAVDPSEFVSARTALVRQLRADGLREVAKQVAALRKPSVAAAAVNATVRAVDPVVARLEDLGSRMRHAQSSLDAAALSALRGERDEVLAAWVAAAREHAGGLTAAVEAEVRDTAVAALADAAASEIVTSGSLTRALSYSGFGEVDVADAVARTSTGVVLTRIEGGKGSPDEEPEEDEQPDEELEAPKEPDEDEEPGEEPEPTEDEEPDEEPEEDEEPVEELDEDKEPEPEDEPAEDEEDEGEPTTRPATRSVRASDLRALEMELDAAEKVVAAARAARKQAAADDEAAQKALAGAASRVEQAEQALRAAQEEAAAAASTAKGSAEALESAEDELRRSRRERDAARAALEEAEDR